MRRRTGMNSHGGPASREAATVILKGSLRRS